MDSDLLKADERTMFALRGLYQSYGYCQYKVSRFEEYDFYMQNKEFLTSEQVLAFSDTNGRLMALKPDVTLSIIKNTKDDGRTRKLFYTENVYRVPHNAYGFCEILQTGLECIGEVDVYAMCEVLELAAKSLGEISVKNALDLSDLGVISGILTHAKIKAPARAAILRAFGEKSPHALTRACLDCGADAEAQRLLLSLLSLHGPLSEAVAKLLALPLPAECESAVEELRIVAETLAACGVGGVNLDFSVVNNMDYYNGLIFNGFVEGVAASVLSGGRYDSLLAKMGRRGGAIGFAVYLDQLERLYDAKPLYDVDAVVTYDDSVLCSDVQRAAAALRSEGRSVRVQRQLPAGLRCREVVELAGKGADA